MRQAILMALILLGVQHISAQDNTVTVTWNAETGIPSVASSSAAITSSVSGGHVVISNSDTNSEYTYILEGKSTDGSFTLNSDFKNTIVLNQLSLHSSKGEAINLKCGKRTALVLTDNTENNLSDAETNLGQKAVVYSKGHIELEGAGKLSLTANAIHGLFTKEYCQFKSSTGTINISCKAAGAKGVKSKSNIIINGGTFNISVLGNALIEEENGVRDTSTAACLKADTAVIIKHGNLRLLASGSAGKCINCDGTLTIGEESTARDTTALSIYAQSLGCIFGEESTDGTDTQSKPKAIKVDGTITINNGLIDLYTSQEGGEGLESKTNIVMNNGMIHAYCKDDCINTSGDIVFNDGFVYCASDGNDAIDTNLKGIDVPAITVNGATVIGISAGGRKEQGIDTNRSPVYVNKGYFLSVGGEQGGVEPKMRGTQAAVYLRQAQLSKNKYYTFYCNSLPLFTAFMNCQPTGSYITMSAENLTTGSVCSIAESNTAPVGYSEKVDELFWLYPSYTDHSALYSWSQDTNYTKIDATAGQTTGISLTDNAYKEKGFFYDLQGKQLSTPLISGVYIHNGKSVLVTM